MHEQFAGLIKASVGKMSIKKTRRKKKVERNETVRKKGKMKMKSAIF